MNRIRFATISLIVIFALVASAQQPAHPAQGSLPSVDEHVKLLSEKLGLTPDQQAKAKPIVQEMNDGMAKLMQDESLSREERHARAKTVQTTADKKLREILTADQKKRLDELEAPHQGPHGSSPHQPQ